MEVKEMNLDDLIEHGFLIRAEEITEAEGQVFVYLTDDDGSEHLYRYIPKNTRHR